MNGKIRTVIINLKNVLTTDLKVINFESFLKCYETKSIGFRIIVSKNICYLCGSKN